MSDFSSDSLKKLKITEIGFSGRMIFFDGRRIFTHVEKKLIFKIGFVTSSSDFFNIGADSFLSKSEQRKEESERVRQ